MRKICKINGCLRFVNADGYCLLHSYYRTDKKCSINGCNRGFYANDFCRIHNKPAKSYKRTGEVCKALNCKIKVSSINEYCISHREKIKKGLNPDINYRGSYRGKKNHRWNGGVSEYPNHHEFKKNRLIKLKAVNYRCEECGKKTNEVHHLDESKDNHILENLKVLCRKCHFSIYHKGKIGRKKKGMSTLSN